MLFHNKNLFLKKKKRGYLDTTHRQWKDHARTRQEGGYLQAKGGGLRRRLGLELGLRASRTVEKLISL